MAPKEAEVAVPEEAEEASKQEASKEVEEASNNKEQEASAAAAAAGEGAPPPKVAAAEGKRRQQTDAALSAETLDLQQAFQPINAPLWCVTHGRCPPGGPRAGQPFVVIGGGGGSAKTGVTNKVVGDNLVFLLQG